MSERNYIHFKELLTLVHAIEEAAVIIASGKGGFTKTTESIKSLRGMLFPEYAEELAEKVERTRVLLEKEAQQGPMKVQALDYNTSKKRKRKR